MFSLPWHLSEALRDFATLTKFQVDQFLVTWVKSCFLIGQSIDVTTVTTNQTEGKGGIPFGYERLTPEDIEMVAMLNDLSKLHEYYFFSLLMMCWAQSIRENYTSRLWLKDSFFNIKPVWVKKNLLFCFPSPIQITPYLTFKLRWRVTWSYDSWQS